MPLPTTDNNTDAALPTTDNNPETDVIVDDQAKVAADMDLTTIHTYEDTAPDRPKSKAWTVVADLSDDEFQVEVANIDGFQMRKCLLRFRVAGELSPTIQVMEGIRYHGEKGFQSR